MSGPTPTVEQLLINVQTSYTHTPREWLAQHGRTLAAAIAREYPAEVEPSDDRLVDLLLERSDDTRDLVGAVLERLTPAALAQAVLDNPAALALMIDASSDKALYGALARRGHLLLEVLTREPSETPDETPAPTETP